MKIFASWPDWPDAHRDLSGRLPSATVDALGEAYEFARLHHADQVRPAGQPYTTHLLEVLEIAHKVGGLTDVDQLRAALLHDVVEDTPATVDQVRNQFGATTAELVEWLPPRPMITLELEVGIELARLPPAQRDSARPRVMSCGRNRRAGRRGRPGCSSRPGVHR